MSEVLNGFEALEDRVLLAGVVNVALNAAGDIVVTGDNAANHIDIEDLDGDGDYYIYGQDGTTVNYVSNAYGDAADYFDSDDDAYGYGSAYGLSYGDNLIINLKGGSDILDVYDSGVYGDLNVGLDVTVDMGTGNDSVYLEGDGAIALLSLNVNLGVGNDSFEWDGDWNDWDYVQNMTVNGGVGNDYLEVDDLDSYYGSVNLLGGIGSDQINVKDSLFEDLHVDAGAGADSVYVRDVAAYEGYINLGAGQDYLEIDDSGFYGAFFLNGGAGNDTADIHDSYFNYADMHGGIGPNKNDNLYLTNNYFDGRTISKWNVFEDFDT